MMRRIASQLAALILGRRPDAADDAGPARIDPEHLHGGFKLQWGASPDVQAGRKGPGLSWSFQSAPVASRIFKVDEAQLRAARAAHDEGESWERISRQVNPEYDSLSALEQDFYRRALQMAVEEDPKSPGGGASPKG
jgi:hypothetical protein